MGPRTVATYQDRNSCSGTSAGSRERSSWVGNLNYKCLLSHNQTKSSIYVLDVTSLLIRWGFVYKNTGQALGRGVSRIPVRSARPQVDIPEIRASHGDVVRRRCPTADADAMGRRGIAGIATGRSFIARSNEHRHALRDCLLVQRLESRIGRSPIVRLALAVADADDGRRLRRIHQVLHRDETAESGAGTGARGHQNGSVGRRGAGPFRVQNRLAVVAGRSAARYARSNAVIRAAAQCRVDGGQGTGTVTGQAEGGAKGGPVGGGVEVAVFDHGDRLSLAGSACGKKRIQIINGCQVRRRYGLVGRTSGTKGVVCAAFLHRVRCEIVHRDHSRHGWREGRRNLWIAHIGDMPLAVDL